MLELAPSAESKSGRWKWRAAHDRSSPALYLVLLALSVVFLLTGGSVAQASSIYWYGENNSTCWQTGQPGSPSSACDNVNAGYLANPGGNAGGLAHMVEGAAVGDVALTSGSGDYCNYYHLGDQLTSQDANKENQWTGWLPPEPFSSWQEGDSHENVCQADGSTWGQEVRGSALNSSCEGVYAPCGMHHFVSLYTQEQEHKDRPWSSAFNEPTFVITNEVDPHSPEVRGGAWGYLCPLFEDTTTGDILEYCLEEWRFGSGFPGN